MRIATCFGLIVALAGASREEDLDNVVSMTPNQYFVNTVDIKGKACKNRESCSTVLAQESSTMIGQASYKQFMKFVDGCLAYDTSCYASMEIFVVFGREGICIQDDTLSLDLSDFEGWYMDDEFEVVGLAPAANKCAYQGKFTSKDAGVCGFDASESTTAYTVKWDAGDSEFQLKGESEYLVNKGFNMFSGNQNSRCKLQAKNDYKLRVELQNKRYTPKTADEPTTKPDNKTDGQKTEKPTTTTLRTTKPNGDGQKPVTKPQHDATPQITLHPDQGHCAPQDVSFGLHVSVKGDCDSTYACGRFLGFNKTNVDADQFSVAEQFQSACVNDSTACIALMEGTAQFSREEVCHYSDANEFGLDTRMLKTFALKNTMVLGVRGKDSACSQLQLTVHNRKTDAEFSCKRNSVEEAVQKATVSSHSNGNYVVDGDDVVIMQDDLRFNPIDKKCRLNVKRTRDFVIGFERTLVGRRN